MTILAGIKQDERGHFYRLFRAANGWPLIRYCDPPVALRIVGKFKPDARLGEVSIHLERLVNDQWVRV